MKILCRLEQWTQTREEKNGQERAAYGGAGYRRAMNVQWNSSSVCSLDTKFDFGCQCMHVPQHEWQVASGEWDREAEQRKLDENSENFENKKRSEKDLLACLMQQDLRIWLPNSCKGTPDKYRWEQTNTVCDFVHQKWTSSSDRSVTCHFVLLVDHNALGSACYECWVHMSLFSWFLRLGWGFFS